MSICKDCLHYEVCQYHITEETDMTVNECSHGFKNKADYVEVVFCKDCKYWERLYYRPFVEPRNDGRCKALWQFHDAERNITFEDHFCSYGEKESEVKE